MPFLSRKKAVPAAPSSPARPPPPSTGLDISTISSPTAVVQAPINVASKQYTASNQSAAHYPTFSQDGQYSGSQQTSAIPQQQAYHHTQAASQPQYQSYAHSPSANGQQYMPDAFQYPIQPAHSSYTSAADIARPKTSESQRGALKRPIPPPVDTTYQPQPQYRRTSSMGSEQSDNVLYNDQNPNERSSSGATTMSSGSKFGSSEMQQQQNGYMHGDIAGQMSNLATADYSSIPDAGQQVHASAYGSRNQPATTVSHQHNALRALAPAAEIGKPASVQMAQEYSSSTQTFSSPSLSTTSSKRKTASRYALGDFNFIRTLGTGSFGRVHLVRSQHNTRFYAIKVLNKDRVVQMKQVEHTNSEREMLERVRHPFLVNLWGTFKDARNLYMVMDFVSGGELFSLLRKSQRFPDPVAKFFAAEVALALDYLHSLDIIYRDLKPENILLASDGHIKVTDFGFAKYVPDITWTLCGTPDYLAPEIVQSRGYNKSVDWYALGVLMFEMLAGYPPFFTEDSNPMRLYEKIIAGKIRYPAYFTIEAKDLLRNLLTSDLTKRYGNLANGSRDVFAHSWFGEVDWERLYRKEIPAPYVPRVAGEGDASAFESYPETQEQYGQSGPDPHGHLFALF